MNDEKPQLIIFDTKQVEMNFQSKLELANRKIKPLELKSGRNLPQWVNQSDQTDFKKIMSD